MKLHNGEGMRLRQVRCPLPRTDLQNGLVRDANVHFSMTRHGFIVLAIVFSIVWGLELLADLRPFAGIWWTHKQARDYGGIAFLAIFLLLFLHRRG